MTPRELAALWRTEADVLERYAPDLAAVARTHADDLDAALRDAGGHALTLEEGAHESGYSVDRLRHLVADGQIPNAGKKGAPRIRREDLPRKTRQGGAFDPQAVARQLVHRDQ